MKYSKTRIARFLDSFATKAGDNEDTSMVELMMDDHTFIEYEGQGYYLPENNSFFEQNDEEVLDYLNETYHT